MDTFLTQPWLWWIAALVVVAAELATGTVYLLMIALGLLAGGLAAWAGLVFSAQVIIAAVVAAAGCLAVQMRKASQPAASSSERNADVQIDLGNVVEVTQWASDGTCSVQYRGAQWQARLDEFVQGAAPSLGKHHIVAMQANTLVLRAASSASKA